MLTAYLDLPSGLSGDMLLGCLVDAGWPVDDLKATIANLDLPTSEWSIAARQVMKGPMRATFVEVNAQEGHIHRNLDDVCALIAPGKLPPGVAAKAHAVFRRLARAEAKVHGTTPDKIHFHEVGAVDAIIDIVGGVAGLTALGIDRLYASALPMGEGWAKTAHGQIPLPAPATLELLTAVNAPTRPAPGNGEWVTPTAAALLAELATFGQPPIALDRIGIGAGRKDCPWPNVARLWLGQGVSGKGQGASGLASDSSTNHQPLATGHSLIILETNIDDMNPQFYAPACEALFAAGALDVWLTPIQMKKNRPGITLSVLAPLALESILADTLLRHTTTLGVRVLPVAHRHEAHRTIEQVQTPFGPVHLKLKWLGHELLGLAPEYEDCLILARERGAPVKDIYDAAQVAAQSLRSQLTADLPPAEPAHPHAHDHTHKHEQAHEHDHPHPHEHGPHHHH